jgi:hypothetical protein
MIFVFQSLMAPMQPESGDIADLRVRRVANLMATDVRPF